MDVNELRIAGHFEIPDAGVDDEVEINLRVRIASIQRDEIDVTECGDTEPHSLPGGLAVGAVAVAEWPTPAPVDPNQLSLNRDYWEAD